MKVAPSLPLWAWICVLFHLAGIHGLGLDPSADPPLRAAFVTLAHEPDLPAVLFSMHQLEERFVNRYQYHWIFFSTRELSDGFKCLTSNATSATCIYEVIADEHWGTSDWTGQPSPRPFGADVQFGPEPEFPAVDAQRRYRWNSGLFARERRLKDYDWFWKVEPGSQLTQDLHFDVFRFLRDTGIEYGFHRDAHAETKLRLLSPQVKSFIDKHPDLLHKEANVSWLFDTPNSETVLASIDEEVESSVEGGPVGFRKRTN